MKKKRIAFVAPVWEWWPTTLYRDLVESLSEQYHEYEYFFISSARQWVLLHFENKKFDIIISSIPFFWKPPHCVYIIHQHGLYRADRWFTSIPKLLSWLYPYNILFSKIVLYPSEFLKKYYSSNHKDQRVIYNFSPFPIVTNNDFNLSNKKEIILSTVTGFTFYDKARWMLDIFEKLEYIHRDKKITYYLCWDGKYLSLIQEQLKNYKIPENIKITFLWRLDKKELVDLLEKTDIFLYSTFQDTFGISIIEAMSFWIPVILNDYELFYELYDEEFIVDTTTNFIEKITQLINERDYYEEYQIRCEKNLKKFNKDKIINQRKKIIESQSNLI